ncbi:MAG: hypothetical protein JW798_18645 [Prolixibacteraceae bacterium]|nr:hypothetical protein [Prolixibacteraceae bacterium]
MKKLTVLICLLVFTTSLFSAVYDKNMIMNMQKMYKSTTADELIEVANQFERIGLKETGEWLPGYYAAYSYISIMFHNQELSSEQRGKYLDQAQKHIDEIMKLAPTESEIFVLQALLYMMRITDPSEGYTYSTMATEALDKAEVYNAKNPRVFYLKGMNLYYTPDEYGGGKEAAMPLLEKANSLFKTEISQSPLMPTWGKENNFELMNQ